jgi:hypothetical protein
VEKAELELLQRRLDKALATLQESLRRRSPHHRGSPSPETPPRSPQAAPQSSRTGRIAEFVRAAWSRCKEGVLAIFRRP